MKYSVIIPVYNAEKTLDRCLLSLLNQRYDDFEIILVNDGSVDDSLKICQQYCQRYNNITLINQANQGVSVARNNGIVASKGEYISFVDSDDYVTENYFECIDSILAKDNYDFVIFSYAVKTNDTIKAISYENYSSMNHDDVIYKVRDTLCNKMINSPATKLYKSQLIKNNAVCFTLGSSISEDRAFNIKYALNIHSLMISSEVLYYVCLDNNVSLSRKPQKDLEKQLDIVDRDVRTAINASNLKQKEKDIIIEAVNFGNCRVIYKNAKDLHKNRVPFFARMREISKLCKENNEKGYTYPNTRFCRLITLPIRWRLSLLIDLMAWKMSR